MNVIGDLERLFATSLYPNRVAIGIAIVVAGSLVLVAARRRGWVGAVRRHPGRAAVLLVVALAIGLPSAWYLGSPLFIRTALNEPGPSVGVPTESPAVSASPASPAASPAVAHPNGTPAGSSAPPTPGPTPTPPLAAVRSGTFTGADAFHFGSGTATLIETAPGVWSVRFANFSVRNGPDLFVYVSTRAAGYTSGAIEVGRLRATDGNFNMDLPPGANPGGAASIVIWCRQFAVQFAVAPLGT